MGMFINKGNKAFQLSRNDEYVDKSGLIAVVNDTLFKERRFSCVSRCRRFGKSMAARMLCAYYDKSCNSRELFADLEIACHPSFEKHLNQYRVIYLDMTDFVSRYRDDSIVDRIEKALRKEVLEAFPSVEVEESDDLMRCLFRIAQATDEQFIFIIDEWDAICREFPSGTKAMDDYVGWLRSMFKTGTAVDVFAGVYMTGILPIKKYKTESALNNFQEYSMVKPGGMAGYFGFTKDEVRVLAEKHGMDFNELEKWYDGYQIGGQLSIFNPNSVMTAIKEHWCESYWSRTGATDAISDYIGMNYEGLKDDIIAMLAGERRPVNPVGFKNDISIILSRDDVLTVLIHLGYLTYDRVNQECYIPNREVAGEMEIAVRDTGWKNVFETLQRSKQLLRATLDGDAEAVARGIDQTHDEETSILSYNNENSMACVLSIAYYYAKNDYIIHREFASGKGFADLVLIPRKNVSSPAIILELKYDKDADTAIQQIHRRQYPAKVAQYTDNLLLVGVNYNKETKTHTCLIERWEKEY
ncbi:MAG: AAA family ATPase [Prevotella sp.]|nr:AAA family ATPase [Prevotella sp.]